VVTVVLQNRVNELFGIFPGGSPMPKGFAAGVGQFVVPAGTVLVGRDGTASGTSAVAVTRSDDALNSVVSTVDDVDRESGRITSMLAVSDLINGGRPGQFGTGPGATAVTVPQ